jgi:oligopeptide transport system substrate-binding protein
VRWPLLLCCCVLLTAADPDAWVTELAPPGDAWRNTDQVLVANNESEPSTLDPHVMTGIVEARIALALFEGLTTLDPRDLSPRPGLAASWTADADGLGWTFILRDGLHWSDGVAIDAATVRDSWLRALAPATAASYAELFDPIVGAAALRHGQAAEFGVVAHDARTLHVRLERPCPWFLSLAAFHAFAAVPLHAIAAHGERWTRPGSIVCGGPFILTEWSPRERIVLQPNPSWHGHDRVRLRRIELLPYSDLDAAYRLFRQGGIDWMPSIPQPKWDELRWLPEYACSPYLASYFYRINCSRPPFDDVRVRKALSLAIDRQVIAGQILRAGQVPATWLTPAVAGYEPPPGLPTDRAEARRLLAEAGYGPGGKPLSFEVLFNTSEAHKAIAEAIAQQWREQLGVEARLANREWKTYLADSEALRYDVARASWVGDYLDPDTFLALFHSNGGNNRTGWKNARYDALLDAAQRERDPVRRLAQYRELETILVTEQFPIIPIYIYVAQSLVRDRVHGFFENVRDEHPWQYLWVEE